MAERVDSAREAEVLERIEAFRRRPPRLRDEVITLAHGAGGKASAALIDAVFLDAFGGEVTGPGDERDPVRGAGGGDGVDRLGDGPAPAEQAHRDAPGSRQQRLEPRAHVLRGPPGAAHPHHLGAALGESPSRRRERDQLGVGGGEEEDHAEPGS